MLFSSITFLFKFLPLVLLIYYSVPRRWKNPFLMVSSFVFYGWGEPVYLLLMLLSIAVHYVVARGIHRTRGTRKAKLLLVLSVVFSLGLLAYFKYAGFFLDVALPIGISFYTFQLLSYTVDVYRGRVDVQRNIISLATYVSMFPQLIAGPIVRYADVAAELDTREHRWVDVRTGIRRFILGLGKKVILANSLGEVCRAFHDLGGQSVLWYWLYAVAFTLQIYFDFSGYSDMAIGLGRMMGFHFPENFNYPFIARSITEFWRRWHISLSSWFRDYVYIPLGGNRVGRWRHLLNLLVVWLLTGLWHGAGWNFILWGLFFAVVLIVEKLGLLDLLGKSPAPLRHLYVMLLVILSFVLFDADGPATAVTRIGAMFGAEGLPLTDPLSLYYLRSYAVVLGLAILGSTPLVKQAVRRIDQRSLGNTLLTVAEPLATAALLAVVTGYLLDGSFNPFLYFRF